MNRVELSYSGDLKMRQLHSDVEWYAYEAIKLRLADRTFFTPDFLVMLKDGTLEIHEVKGTKYVDGVAKPWIEEDAAVKLKVAAEVFPFKFRLRFYDRKIGWLDSPLV